MITEDYVSFETAKLLKEKGFDEPCECFYDTENNDTSIVNGWMDISNSELEEREFVCYSAPTIQMAMKWLREVYRIIITIDYANICGFGFTYVASVIKLNDNHEIEEGPGLNTCVYGASYEEACEAAVKYCLENLI